MTQAEDFIGTLHVIAASDAPIDRQREAVREVLGRMLGDAQQVLGGNQERVRSWITNLNFELTNHTLQPRTDRFAGLLDYARALLGKWLRERIQLPDGRIAAIICLTSNHRRRPPLRLLEQGAERWALGSDVQAAEPGKLRASIDGGA